MCGIFGYFCREETDMQKVLKLLQILESHQYEDQGEKRPVGGHGAGVCFRDDSGNMVMHKVGKTTSSPAKDLSLLRDFALQKSRIILGHVRHASSDFMSTIECAEAAQPYKVNCLDIAEVVSVHNGKVQNYKDVRKGLSKEHRFQSEIVKLVDSEVVPHLFEENLMICNDEDEARKRTFEMINGSNTVVVLTRSEGRSQLHVLHKGFTRGMHLWKNNKDEIILCSREEPLQQVFGDLLETADFRKEISIQWVPYELRTTSRETYQRTYNVIDS